MARASTEAAPAVAIAQIAKIDLSQYDQAAEHEALRLPPLEESVTHAGPHPFRRDLLLLAALPALAAPPPPGALESPLAAGQRPSYVVGLGASAGGLEALEAFFRGVLLPSGAAFVVVQHLDPTHQSLLVELLQRATALPVQVYSWATRSDPAFIERSNGAIIVLLVFLASEGQKTENRYGAPVK